MAEDARASVLLTQSQLESGFFNGAPVVRIDTLDSEGQEGQTALDTQALPLEETRS